MEEDLDQAPADRDANAVRSPDDEKTLGQIGYDAFAEEARKRGGYHAAWKDSCWQKEYEAAATAVRDKVMEWRPIETAPKDGTYIIVSNAETGAPWVAQFKDQFQSGFRPENPWQSMMLNHRHFKNELASSKPTHWLPLPSPPCVPDREI